MAARTPKKAATSAVLLLGLLFTFGLALYHGMAPHDHSLAQAPEKQQENIGIMVQESLPAAPVVLPQTADQQLPALVNLRAAVAKKEEQERAPAADAGGGAHAQQSQQHTDSLAAFAAPQNLNLLSQQLERQQVMAKMIKQQAPLPFLPPSIPMDLRHPHGAGDLRSRLLREDLSFRHWYGSDEVASADTWPLVVISRLRSEPLLAQMVDSLVAAATTNSSTIPLRRRRCLFAFYAHRHMPEESLPFALQQAQRAHRFCAVKVVVLRDRALMPFGEHSNRWKAVWYTIQAHVWNNATALWLDQQPAIPSHVRIRSAAAAEASPRIYDGPVLFLDDHLKLAPDFASVTTAAFRHLTEGETPHNAVLVRAECGAGTAW